MLEKEKLLVFFTVFKRPVLQTHENKGLFGKGLTHYQTTNFRLLKLKEFADNNFKFDENSRKLSEGVQNTVGKGEIARYEQFLLFPLCFQKACFPGASKGVIVCEWVKEQKPISLHCEHTKYVCTNYQLIPYFCGQHRSR